MEISERDEVENNRIHRKHSNGFNGKENTENVWSQTKGKKVSKKRRGRLPLDYYLVQRTYRRRSELCHRISHSLW